MTSAARKATVNSMQSQLASWAEELRKSKSTHVMVVGYYLNDAAVQLARALEERPDQFGQVIDSQSREFDLSKAKGQEAA